MILLMRDLIMLLLKIFNSKSIKEMY